MGREEDNAREILHRQPVTVKGRMSSGGDSLKFSGFCQSSRKPQRPANSGEHIL